MTDTHAPRGVVVTRSRRWTAILRSPVGLAALLLIAVQLAWRVPRVLSGYFSQDDFVLLARARDLGPSTDLLNLSPMGEVSPGASLAVAATAAAPSSDWAIASATIVVLHALVMVLFWVVLARLVGERWLAWPLLALAVTSPLVLASTQQWSWALVHLPAAGLLLAATWAILARVQDGWRAGEPVAVLALALALAFDERAVLFPLVLLLVTALVHPGSRALSRVTAAVRSHRGMWVASMLTVAAYLLVRGGDHPWVRLGSVAEWRAVADSGWRQLVTGAVGGPWQGEMAHGALAPTGNWALALAVVVCLLAVGHVVHEGGGRALQGIASILLLGVVSLVLAGVSTDGSVLAALDALPRHLADLWVGIVLVAAATARGLDLGGPVSAAVSDVVGTARARVLLSGLVVVALFGSGVVTGRQMLTELSHSDDRAYVASVRAALAADPQVVLLDGATPEGVVSSLFGDWARVSTVVGSVPEHPAFDQPSPRLRIVDGAGGLHPVSLVGAIGMVEPENTSCGHPIRSEGRTIRLQGLVPAGQRVLRLGYYTDGDTFATVELPLTTWRIPIRTGLNAIDLVVDEEFREVRISIEAAPQTVCLAKLEVGEPALPPSAVPLGP